MVCVWMEPLIPLVIMMRGRRFHPCWLRRGCLFIKFADGGGLRESITAVHKFQVLYFGVGVGREWGFSIWWDTY